MGSRLPGALFAASDRSVGRTLAASLVAARLGGQAKVVLADWGFGQSPLLRYFDAERLAVARDGLAGEGLSVAPGLRLFSSAFCADPGEAAGRLNALLADADLLVCSAHTMPQGLDCDFRLGFVVFDYQGESPFRAAAMVGGVRAVCGKALAMPSWVDAGFLGLSAQRKRAGEAFAKVEDAGTITGGMARLELPRIVGRASLCDLVSMHTTDAALLSFLETAAGLVRGECLPEGHAPSSFWEMAAQGGEADGGSVAGLLDLLGLETGSVPAGAEADGEEADTGEESAPVAEAEDIPEDAAEEERSVATDTGGDTEPEDAEGGDTAEEGDAVPGEEEAAVPDGRDLMARLEAWAEYDINEIYPTFRERIVGLGLTPLDEERQTVTAYAAFNRAYAAWGGTRKKDGWLPALIHCLGMVDRAARDRNQVELPVRQRVEDMFDQTDNPLARSPEMAAVRMVNLAGIVVGATQPGREDWLGYAEAAAAKVVGLSPPGGPGDWSKVADLRRMVMALALRLPRFADAKAGERSALERERDRLPDGLRALVADDEIGERVRGIRAAMEGLI